MIRVLYFASLRDQAGCESEDVDAAGSSAADLYATLATRRGFVLPRDRLRVAVDGEFADWDASLADGVELAFIPPVSGG